MPADRTISKIANHGKSGHKTGYEQSQDCSRTLLCYEFLRSISDFALQGEGGFCVDWASVLAIGCK